jgi:hypothetical protein
VHNVFYVSQLKKCLCVTEKQIPIEKLDAGEDLIKSTLSKFKKRLKELPVNLNDISITNNAIFASSVSHSDDITNDNTSFAPTRIACWTPHLIYVFFMIQYAVVQASVYFFYMPNVYGYNSFFVRYVLVGNQFGFGK